VLIAFLNSTSYLVSSTFSSGYSFAPFFVGCFLSSFFGGAFPPFLFLSSTISSYLLKSLNTSESSLSSLGNLSSLITSSSESAFNYKQVY